ncbi:MAG TPA: nitroreductase family protein [Methylotenera sp.]|nr:nitroreductase family protein [Methylotenera sp.]
MQLPKVEMSIFETILARRSVRSYLAKMVDKDTVSALLEAAVRAPTAIHQEPWAFVIIQDREVLHDLSDRAKPIFIAEARQSNAILTDDTLDVFDNPDFNIFYDANTLILICGNTTTPFVSADCWLAAENLILAACAMGLGTCIISSALSALNTSEVKVHLHIPNEFSVIVPIIVGYPNDEIAPTVRKNPVVFANIAAP